MDIRKLIMGTVCFVLTAGIQVISAQVVTNVPPDRPNNRFLTEVYIEMQRPGLSVIGFDNAGYRGYGLKQILNQVYTTGNNDQKELFIKILAIARQTIDVTPPDAGEIEVNSNRLQYLAFEALCSYVLQNNGITPEISNDDYGIPIRDHALVLNEFTHAIMALVNSDDLTAPGPKDYVKHVNTYTNIARAIDLYLALENAYMFWDYDHWLSETSWKLLSKSEKTDLMNRFIADLKNLWEAHVHKEIAGIGGIQQDEVESGNRPLKGHLALGYSVLAIQKASGWLDVVGHLEEAKSRASDYAGGSDRTIYWNYQTSGGQRFWAEGPYYFNFAMLDVVPFWHAVRGNGMLGSLSDPFQNSWFLNPVEWLADISTPDGLTPPLDDGNKHRISSSSMLRWSGIYGDAEIGKKFNSIYQKLKAKNEATGTTLQNIG